MKSEAFAFVGLGSNMGDRLQFLRQALVLISRLEGVRLDPSQSVASLFESEPLGGLPTQAQFFNSALRVETSLEPPALMQALLDVEAAMGRRREHRWEDRTIDLDLLMYGDRVLESEGLTVPHPRMHQRRFVLEPLAEVAAGAMHPLLGKTIAQLAAELRDSSEQKLVRIMEPRWAATS